MQTAKGSNSKSSAGFGKWLSDLWNGRGAFAPLAALARWRVVLVECAVLAIVCGGVYLLRYQARAAHQRDLLQHTAARLNSVVLELEAERRDLAAAQHRRDVLAGFILDKEGRARLLSSLTDASERSGLEFVSISPEPKENFEQYARCRSLLTVEAGFDDLLGFVRRLETEGTPCSLVQLDIESKTRARAAASAAAQGAAGAKAIARERVTLVIETYATADPPPADQKKNKKKRR